ncbi:hypothetical protein [Streptomyces sp. NPDC059786]|uniref:hypothetical protein n=1 Tax=Streptomyces sp. NPDC059786 TaxID=3346946 RepID=UPI0036610025
MKDLGESNGGHQAERRGLSRRGLFGLAGGSALALGGLALTANAATQGQDEAAADTTLAADPKGMLGANFNEEPSGMTNTVLDTLGTKWVRGFVAMPKLDSVAAAQQPAIQSLLAFSAAGYRTVLSLKFPFADKQIPQPGSTAMDVELARVDKVLAAVLGKVDILVIGNEPFIETRQQDRAALLNPFYQAVAAHVIAKRASSCGSGCRTTLYMGALNRLEDAAWRTAATDVWLAYVKATPEIAGVDIHPHVAAIEHTAIYTDYVMTRMRAEQRFLATEFSLVRWWKEHWSDQVPAVYASRYGIPAGTLVWQEVRDAAAAPVTQQRWSDLLMNSSWFSTRQNYLTNQVRQLRATGRLAVATYGTLQQPAMVKDITADKMPWLLNSLYTNLVAQPSAGGAKAHHPTFFDEFKALQSA